MGEKITTLLAIFLCASSLVYSQNKQIDFSYLNPDRSFKDRVEILVNQMTLDEKISQLTNDAKAIPRLKIPEYNWWNEGLHGVARAGFATVFPQSISIAASFNKTLVYEVAKAISNEARVKHHEFLKLGKRGIYTGLTLWSPNINIFRDPRWGRGHETYGEDPFLTGELASEFIKGLQGNHPKYLKTIATSKHFAVHSGPERLRHSFDVDVSDRDLFETYLPAFRKTVIDANVSSIMGAYNRFRGQSCSGHDFLLNQLLREEWGFEGYVVSDCGAIRDIHLHHHLATQEYEAAAIGIQGGCDLNCGGYYTFLKQAYDQKLIEVETIDLAVKRLMLARFQLGMFDPDALVPYSQISPKILCSESHNALAREAARQSIVLLKNENQILPLNKLNVKRIAVIGPNADNWESLVGNYHGTPKNPVTFLKGIQNKVGDKIDVLYSPGSHLSEEVKNLKPIPGIYFETFDGEKGLKANYYKSTNFQGDPVLVRTDENINFLWEHQPITKELVDHFSVKWEGYLVPPCSGDFELAVFSKRGMLLKIDSKEITNGKGSIHHAKYKTATMRLEAGKKYPIEVYFSSDASDARAQLLWSIPNPNMLEEAIAAANKSDLAVVVLGLSQRIEGEGGDRENIGLPKTQIELLKAIASTGKPVVLVVNAGSAITIPWAKENIEAIFYVGYPGQEGGNALADVLFGEYNPAGRLPITYYSSLSELPPFEDYNMKGRTYRYYKGTPLYPFGYGLSYTKFKYNDLKIPKKITAGEHVEISVTVTNIGQRSGDEVVQLYIQDLNASTIRPLKQLEGFQRVTLNSGESKVVRFKLTPRQLSIINSEGNRVIESGFYKISVGGEQPDLNKKNRISTTEVLSSKLKVIGHLKFMQR